MHRFSRSGSKPEVPIRIETFFDRGGRDLIDLLEYCVISLRKDILFHYLVRQYRQRPTAGGAVAMYDMFCAADAPARISAANVLAPKDMRLEQAMVPFRQSLLSCAADEVVSDNVASDHAATEPRRPMVDPFPPKYLFDPVVQSLMASSDTQWQDVESHYDPSITPHANLPDGRMTANQRLFVDRIWTPVVRPRLVAAGFWRIATVS